MTSVPNERSPIYFLEIASGQYGPVEIFVDEAGQVITITDETEGGYVKLNVSEARMVRDWLNKALP